MHRFISCGFVSIEALLTLEANAQELYDRVGKDEFRVYAEVTPDRIKQYTQAV